MDHKLVLEVAVVVGVEEERVDHKLVLEMEVAAMALAVVVAEVGARTGIQELLEVVLACGFLQPAPATRLAHPTQVVTALQTLALWEARA